jgi:Tfp pilus assembly protein PilF
MSLITDAVRAAQHERAQQLAGRADDALVEGFFAYRAPGHKRRAPGGLALGGMVIVTIALAAYGYRRLRGEPTGLRLVRQPSAAIAQQSTTPPLPAPAPIAASAATMSGRRVVVQSVDTASPPRSKRLSEGPAVHVGRPTTGGTAAALTTAGDTATRPSATVATPPVATPPVASPAPAAATAASAPRVRLGGAMPSAVDLLFAKAMRAHAQRDLDGAKQLYDQALAVGPASPALYNNYGILLLERGEHAAAVAMLRQAVSIEPTYARAWANLGAAYAAEGSQTAATVAYQQAIKFNRSDSVATVNLAQQYHALGSLSDARRLLDEVVKAAPGFADAYYELGRVLYDQNDVAASIRAFERYISLAGPGAASQVATVRAYISALRAKP